MKKIALLLAVVCLAAVFATVCSAAEDFIAFDFRTEDAIKQKATLSTAGIKDEQYVDGAYEVYTTTSDPNIKLSLKSKYKFEASDYPVIRIDYKVIQGAPTNGQLFFATTTEDFTMGSAGTYTDYPIDLTTADYQSAVIDMEFLASSQWADSVNLLRFDITTIPDCRVAVRFVGLFPSEKAANEFDYDKWAEENPPYVKGSTATTAPADTATTAPAEDASAPQTADPFTAVAAVMAISAGAALAIKKRR